MELGARSQTPCVIIILQGEQAPVISQSELSFLLEGHDTLLIKIYKPFHSDLAKHHTKFIFSGSSTEMDEERY